MTGAAGNIVPDAFDSAAATYDLEFEHNPVTERLRKIVWRTLLKSFPARARVLDLSCGTGTDAVFLAQNGFSVMAVDGSEQMIEQARRKVARWGLGHLVNLKRLPLEQLSELTQGGSSAPYDGVLSNFGGLNCVQDLPSVLRDIAMLTRPDGIFISCILGKVYPWEIASFFTRGRFREGLRRLRDASTVNLGNGSIRVKYYMPGQVKNLARPWFAARRSYALSVISPPPNSRQFVERFPHLTTFLSSVEDTIRHLPPFSGLGDHFVVEFQRKRSGA